jgi:uncharacterized membrane protein YhhN
MTTTFDGTRQAILAARRPALWLILIAIAAALAIAGVYLPLPWLHYVAKPMTTLLIVAMVWRASSSGSAYRNGIVIGLLLSTAGDVFLMLPGNYFLFGLASFLLAHLAYLFAFTRRARLFAIAWPMLACALSAALAVAALWSKLPRGLVLPVVVYAAVLAAMAAQALVVWRRRRDHPTLLAAVGGLFFMASDSMLSIESFVTPFAVAPLAVLTTYWIAQSLIGLSATGEPTWPRPADPP